MANLRKGRGGDNKSVDYDIYVDTAKHFLLASQTSMAVNLLIHGR